MKLILLFLSSVGLACEYDKYVKLRPETKTPFGSIPYDICENKNGEWPLNVNHLKQSPLAFVNYRGPYLNKGGYDAIKVVNASGGNLKKERFRSYDALITTSGTSSGTYRAHSSILANHFPQLELLKEIPYKDRTCFPEWDRHQNKWINRCSIQQPRESEFCKNIYNPKVNYAVRSLGTSNTTYGSLLNLADFYDKNHIRSRYINSLTYSDQVSEPFSTNLLRRNLRADEGQEYFKKYYENNVLFVSPSIRSFSQGDIFTTLTPFIINSDGASGSDSVLLYPIIAASASISPTLKDRILASKTLVPTLMYLFKSSYYDYEDPNAHHVSLKMPSEYLDKKLDPIPGKPVNYQYEIAPSDPAPLLNKIIENAKNLTHIPPIARMKVYDVVVTNTGTRDYKIPNFYEDLTYLFKSALRDGENIEFVVDLYDSWSEKEIKSYHFKLLRGNAVIEKMNPDGSILKIKIPFQKKDTRLDTRTDILLYVNDGKYNSAPAYISVKHLQTVEEGHYFK